MNPQSARWHFKFRSLLNFVGIAFVFAVIVTVTAQFEGGFFVLLIAAAISYFLYFHVLEKRAITIDCPKCHKAIATNTIWVCGVCKKKNTKTDAFPFVHRCEHEDCRAEPKAYLCHHGCGKLIFLTEDHQEENYAYAYRETPPVPDQNREEISGQEKAKRDLEHQLIMTRLNAKLKEAKKLVEPPVEKPVRELMEEDFTRHNTRTMGAFEIAEREKAANAVRYKDDPEMLERANLSVDTWLRERI